MTTYFCFFASITPFGPVYYFIYMIILDLVSQFAKLVILWPLRLSLARASNYCHIWCTILDFRLESQRSVHFLERKNSEEENQTKIEWSSSSQNANGLSQVEIKVFQN